MCESRILRMVEGPTPRRTGSKGSWWGRQAARKSPPHAAWAEPNRRAIDTPWKLHLAQAGRSLILTALACAMILPGSAFADTLTYKNARFGTTVTFPARIFLQAMEPPPMGEGMTFLSADGASLGTYAMNNALELSPEEFALQVSDCAVGECEMTYLQIDGDRIVFSGERNGSIFRKDWIFGEENVIHGLTITYPSSTWETYDEWVEGISLSFGGP